MLQPVGQPRDHPLGQDLAQPLAKLWQLDLGILAEGDSKLAVVRPAHEQHHVVDAEIRGDLAHEAHGDLDVLGLGLALDFGQTLHRHLPGQLEVRARRRPEPQHELTGVNLGKELGAHLHAQHPEDQPARRDVSRHHHPAQVHEPVHHLAVDLEHPIEHAQLRFAIGAMAAMARRA